VKRWATPLLALAILLLNLWLNAPLFMAGDMPFRGSIERGYVGMARFVSEHPSPWGWNPLQYCGLPVQFMYVPALPYLAALWIHLLPHVAPDNIFRFLVGLFTCLGPVTMFLFAVQFTGSRRWALVAAVCYSLFSPSYGLFPAVEKDRGIVQLPWRVQVLAKYGEGPHNTALMLLPLGLLALWRAAKSRAYPRIFLAAVVLAAIPLVNWVGAFSLAISSLLLLLAAWGEPEFQVRPAFAAAGLAYLLACFWLMPSFVRTIVFNWPVDSFAYQLGRQQAWLIAGAAAGAVVIRLLFRWMRGSAYFCLVTMGAFVFGWISTVFYIYGIDVIPESRRYAIEFEFFFALAVVEAIRLAVRSLNGTVRLCAWGSAGVMLLAGTPQLWAYLSQGWSAWRPSPPENTIEYQLATWLAAHPSQGRVFASGGMRFRLNSWFDIQQVGGGFETGLKNRVPLELAYHVRSGTGDTMTQLKALGVQSVVLHGPSSREYYRDFSRHERVSSVLPVAYHLEDDTVYAMPPRTLAHLVSPDEVFEGDAWNHPEDLGRYAAAIDNPGLDVRWDGPSALSVSGAIPAGKVISLQVNADPGWHAAQDGHEVELTRDRLGFIVIHPSPAAAARIDLQFRATAEPRIMAAISILAWVGALTMLWRSRATSRKTAPPFRPAVPPEPPSSARRSTG
jgi:hypothetical protein